MRELEHWYQVRYIAYLCEDTVPIASSPVLLVDGVFGLIRTRGDCGDHGEGVHCQ